MMNSWDQPLAAATTSTFEELAFLVASGAPDDQQSAAPFAAAVMVAFTGPRSGQVTVRVTRDLFETAGTNMLGAAEALDDASLHDALGELANVVTGNVLPAVAGRAHTFNLAAPRPVPVAGDEGTADDATRVVLGFEGGRAEVTLTMAMAASVA